MIANSPTGMALAALATILGSCASSSTSRSNYARVLAKPEYAHAHWGIHVEDLSTGEVLIGTNSDRLFAPASNTKLFSVAAAFEEFGPEHRFETSIYRQGELSADGTLAGELILRPAGDLTLGGRDDGEGGIAYGNSDHIYANGNPNTQLTTASPLAGLDNLAAQIRSAGIKSVDDVIVDGRLFTPTASTGSGPSSVTPVVINDNLVDFIIRPTTRGKPARVDFRPQSPNYVVDSRVRTVGRGTYGVRIQSPRPGYFVLSGAIPLRYPPQVEVHEVHDPSANARHLLIEALGRAGVAVIARAVGPNPSHRLPPSCDGLPIVAR